MRETHVLRNLVRLIIEKSRDVHVDPPTEQVLHTVHEALCLSSSIVSLMIRLNILTVILILILLNRSYI